MSSFIGFKEIIEEQKKPLPCKIEKAVEAIRKGFSLSKHHTALAFSSGKDSTVLWHLIRTYCPEQTARTSGSGCTGTVQSVNPSSRYPGCLWMI